VGLGKPMAFAYRALPFVFAAMRKVTPVASAFQACSSAFAEAKTVAPQIVWVTMVAPAYSYLACCPSAVGSRNSFWRVFPSF